MSLGWDFLETWECNFRRLHYELPSCSETSSRGTRHGMGLSHRNVSVRVFTLTARIPFLWLKGGAFPKIWRILFLREVCSRGAIFLPENLLHWTRASTSPNKGISEYWKVGLLAALGVLISVEYLLFLTMQARCSCLLLNWRKKVKYHHNLIWLNTTEGFEKKLVRLRHEPVYMWSNCKTQNNLFLFPKTCRELLEKSILNFRIQKIYTTSLHGFKLNLHTRIWGLFDPGEM